MSILLPPDVIQPFALSFRRDDFHIIAFLSGHPLYEAVEAMISARRDGEFAIRAILTRHDQSQIDHINDEHLFDDMRGVERERVKCAIGFERRESKGAVRARLEFVSHRNEPVVFELHTVGPANKMGAGLTDPGHHSLQSSLPIMYREASTLAGAATKVSIDGVSCSIPTKIERGSFKALEAYYSEGFAMAAIRAGSRTMSVRERPSQASVGAAWLFESDGRPLRYEVKEVTNPEEAGILIDADRERIAGRFRDGRFTLTGIERRGDGSSILAAAFRDKSFSFSLPGIGELVSGGVSVSEMRDRTIIRLEPSEPPWARARPVTVTCSRTGSLLTFETTIGALAP